MAGRFSGAYVAVLAWLVIQETASLKLSTIKVPSVVKSGDSVTMKCEYDLENVPLYSIKWYWNEEEFYRYVPRQSPPYQAFFLPFLNVDMAKSGENTVTLREIQRQLSGYYKCEVTSDGPLFHTDILGAKMTVIEIPKNDPILTIKGDTKIEKGKSVNAGCLSNASDPAANITWFINNKKITNSSPSTKITPTHIQDNNLNLKSSISKISFISNKSQFNNGVMTIRCEASIFDLWNKSVEDFVRDDSPKAAQVLESTQLQSQIDPIFGNSGHHDPSYISTTAVLIVNVCFIFR